MRPECEGRITPATVLNPGIGSRNDTALGLQVNFQAGVGVILVNAVHLQTRGDGDRDFHGNPDYFPSAGLAANPDFDPLTQHGEWPAGNFISTTLIRRSPGH